MPTLKSSPTLLLLATLGWSFAVQAQPQDDPRALMFQARIKQQRAGGADPAGAAALYRKVIALMPSSSEARLRLSEALLESGDLEGAVAPALKATELNPRNSEAWVHLGMLQTLRLKADPSSRLEARRAFLEASKLLPADPEVWYRLAEVNQLLADDEGALKAWIGLGRMHPTMRFGDASLEEIAWERAALLAASLNRYEPRREAIMALCQSPNPDKGHLRLLDELAREQADKGFLGHAEESFLLLGYHYPNEPAIWENVSRIQLQTGRFEEALKTYRQAESLKASPRLSYFQGICLMSLGRMPEAEAVWRKLFASRVIPSEDKEFQQNARFFHAASVLLQGRPAATLDLLQSWPGSDNQAELLGLKGQALIQTKNWKAARGVLETGMKRFPDLSLFQGAKATPPSLLKEGVLFKKDAQAALVQLDLESTAGLWAEFRQWDKSLEAVRQARSMAPTKRIDLLMLQSNALDQLGRTQEAIAVLREGQKVDPNFPMLQNNLGYLLLENNGDLKEASSLIESAMKQDPKSGSTVDSWGWVLFKQERYQESEIALRKAVEMAPYSPEIRMHLGEVLLKLNRAEETLDQWERALAFAFPQRKELEEKARKLRADLAKKASGSSSTAPPEPEDDPNVEEEAP